ncbi:2-nitropropane dioxygenase [Heliomicrobium modesticaldum Ice1]|uniref:Probable nitronate monooxygenase n=1 Tax=Heliobacterium modesticaldum (strain ATCC 51547 / Ice1) TaxID=498761 RepID=B0TGW2_HELMI|nr:nitronate monooxygenase [Heliomicrobium modesticaldum]ABZ84723.1 2-nitropropane dioxygenase [Heliomicrobium modesticaldum Ice1]
MKLPELKIGHLVAKLPIIQGGMAIRISTAPLAAAVANEGGIGLIAATGMTLDELREEIREARRRTRGIIGINCLFAVREFPNLVKTAIKEGIDLVVSGAGFSRDMFQWGRESGTPIVPIVSSARLARMAEKLGAAAVVVEGKEAGGHLGTDEPMKKILPEVVASVDIPVIAAGGVIDGHDIVEVLNMGASGVQMGTRFAASEESAAAPEFKELYLRATHDDVILIDSPVGLPGRGLKTPFWHSLTSGADFSPKHCVGCLKHCSKRFCIVEALDKAQKGDLQTGLVFSGEHVERIKEILPVRRIVQNILQEVEAY